VEVAVDVLESDWAFNMYFFDNNGAYIDGVSLTQLVDTVEFKLRVESSSNIFPDGGAIAIFNFNNEFLDAIAYGVSGVSSLMLERGCNELGENCEVPEFPMGANPVPMISEMVVPESGQTLSRFGCGFAPEDFEFQVADDTKAAINVDQIIFEDTQMCPSEAPSSIPSSSPSGRPSMTPSIIPSLALSEEPSLTESSAPSLALSGAPSQLQPLTPSSTPSLEPSAFPSDTPSLTHPVDTCTETCKTFLFKEAGAIMSKMNVFGHCSSHCLKNEHIAKKLQHGWACDADCECVEPCQTDDK